MVGVSNLNNFLSLPLSAPLSEKGSVEGNFIFNEDSTDWEDNTAVAFLIGRCV